MFCEFDNNEIHKERTFIFALRSPAGSDDDYYIINYKDDLLNKSDNFYDDIKHEDYSYEDDNDDIEIMSLHSSSYKKRKSKYYSIVLDESLYGDEKEYKL